MTKTVFRIQSGEVVAIRCAVHSRPASDGIFDVRRRDVEHLISKRNITMTLSKDDSIMVFYRVDKRANLSSKSLFKSQGRKDMLCYKEG